MGTKKFDDKYMKKNIINNYENGRGSLCTIPGKIGIWKSWFLRREENQSTGGENLFVTIAHYHTFYETKGDVSILTLI